MFIGVARLKITFQGGGGYQSLSGLVVGSVCPVPLHKLHSTDAATFLSETVYLPHPLHFGQSPSGRMCSMSVRVVAEPRLVNRELYGFVSIVTMMFVVSRLQDGQDSVNLFSLL